MLDVALEKAQELGYDENKPRLKEARVNLPMVYIRIRFRWDFIFLFLAHNQRRIFRTIIHSSVDCKWEDSFSFLSILVWTFSLHAVDHQKKFSNLLSRIFKLCTTIFENIKCIVAVLRSLSHRSFSHFQEEEINLIEPFIHLPSADEYPDYYESVEQPIDMTMIKDKVDKGSVNSLILLYLKNTSLWIRFSTNVNKISSMISIACFKMRKPITSMNLISSKMLLVSNVFYLKSIAFSWSKKTN